MEAARRALASEGLTDDMRLGVTQGLAMTLASLGRMSEARVLFDSLWAMAGPVARTGYSSILPVIAGLADSSFAARALESLAESPPEPGARQGFAYALELFELSRGDEARARQHLRRAAETEGVPSTSTRSLIEAALGWATSSPATLWPGWHE